MSFNPLINSTYGGLAGFTQLISGTFHTGILRQLNGALDGVEWYRGQLSWTPEFRPVFKMDFYRSAVDKKERTYESKTETT